MSELSYLIQREPSGRDHEASAVLSHLSDEAGIAAAAELGLALWCDDNVLRQRARGRGVSSFSVLDLTTVLRRRGVSIETEEELARHLAALNALDITFDGRLSTGRKQPSRWSYTVN